MMSLQPSVVLGRQAETDQHDVGTWCQCLVTLSNSPFPTFAELATSGRDLDEGTLVGTNAVR